MSQLIIPVTFAAIGSIWGPTGAQLGWMAGSLIQGARTVVRTGSLADLTGQTAAYGTYIPFVIGKQRIVGNIIWCADRKTYDIQKRQGKGGPIQSSYGYTISLAIGLCKGPILGISRVWAGDNLIVDARTAANPLPGELYLGTMTQMPDPTYEAAVGAGNAPAYRGLAYTVFTDFDLGASSQIPPFSFEVIGGNSL